MVQCKDCKYWIEEEKECHRYPPVTKIVYGMHTQTDNPIWPRTERGWKCGEGAAN